MRLNRVRRSGVHRRQPPVPAVWSATAPGLRPSRHGPGSGRSACAGTRTRGCASACRQRAPRRRRLRATSCKAMRSNRTVRPSHAICCTSGLACAFAVDSPLRLALQSLVGTCPCAEMLSLLPRDSPSRAGRNGKVEHLGAVGTAEHLYPARAAKSPENKSTAGDGDSYRQGIAKLPL